MKHKLSILVVAAVCVFLSAAVSAQITKLEELPWVFGPSVGQIGGKAEIKLPDGYAFLDPAGARELNRLTENPDPGMDEYVFAKQDLSWIAFFSFDPVGYVKDDEQLDATGLLSSVTEATEASNTERQENGWESVHIAGWAFQPQYDKNIKSLEWAFRLKSEQSNSETINYNTRLLGRKGVMQVMLVTRPDSLDAAVADFKAKLPGFSFTAGESYADYRAGDHVAEYGLAALITGGAIAVASKKGLFAMVGLFLLKMWKVVLVAMAALGAGLKSRFSKGKNDPS